VLVQQGFTVLAIRPTLAATIAAVAQTRPDLCLLDRHFTDGEGTRAIGEVLRAGGGVTKVIMLTADHDPEGMGFAIASGAAGYVHKSCGLAALVAAIRRAYAGDPLELPSPPLGHRARPGRDMDAVRLASFLTQRERQCLALLADGLGT